jgi:hypothetical protein
VLPSSASIVFRWAAFHDVYFDAPASQRAALEHRGDCRPGLSLRGAHLPHAHQMPRRCAEARRVRRRYMHPLGWRRRRRSGKRGELEHASPWCPNPEGRQSSRALKALHHVRRVHGDGFYCRRHWPVWTRSAAADGRHPGSAPTRSRRSSAVRRAGLLYLDHRGAGAPPQGAEARRRRWRPPALRAPPGATPAVLTLRLGIAAQRGSTAASRCRSRPLAAGSCRR